MRNANNQNVFLNVKLLIQVILIKTPLRCDKFKKEKILNLKMLN